MKKKFAKKSSVVIVLLVIMMFMMVGCSNTTKDGEESSLTNNNVASTNDSEKDDKSSEEVVEVTMWGGWGGDQVPLLEEQVEIFNNSQDKIHVTYNVQDGMEQKLLTAIASNSAPDVVLWDRFVTSLYAPKGAFTALDDYVYRDAIDMTDFYQPTVNELTVDGKLYGLPVMVDTRILFYNKDLLAAAGVDPESITSWDTLREAAIKLTIRENDDLVQSGFSLKDLGLFNNWIKQAGGKMVDDSTVPAKTAYNSVAGLEVLKYWDQLLNVDKVYDLGFEDGYGGDGFKAGKVAITFNGPWSLSGYKDAGLNFGVIHQPTGPSGDRTAMMGGFGLIIPNKAKNAEEAWEFIKWWTTNPESGVAFAKATGNLPASKKAGADPYFAEDEILKVFIEALNYADIRPKVPGYGDAEWFALTAELQKFVAGEVSAEEALSNAQIQGDQILLEASNE